MIKNYFINLWNIVSNAGIFSAKNFKSMPLIWVLILFQILIGAPILYITDTTSFSIMDAKTIIFVVLGGILFFLALFFMFKLVFNIAAKALDKDKFTNFKVLKSLLFLGLFNCFPALFVFICLGLAGIYEQHIGFLQIAAVFFTYAFYLAMSLSICSIANWQDRNIPKAILKSLTTFFSTIKYTMVVFIFIFGLANIISFAICLILYAILLYFNILTTELSNAISAIVKVYCLYVFTTFYIGVQAEIIKGYANEKL